ncbi:ABC transporter permease [Paenibacillus sp. CGMCC 1.16610]|uniref:FtsX-like permease family protein n=1 Tax=Paenibacillus anseongense TaxID=2682845 RepID=A0ABW9UI82_9BACL|nr:MULTISPECIES: ABC transporter permease [Paenibacillus]MBA2942669.1 ABC transporter permease [Paenibacillus sp. CGMCC 1.16610]MVQ38155.1 FtsX-like permease family protein [Paenibacillus anseongense]
MSINQLIIQNLKANIKHYYLYIFALMFSVALYFAFVTLQYDPALDQTRGSIKGAAAIKSASVLLIVIVAIFNLYANNIFVKRRSKEIGLLQLIGMTKTSIFRILSTENFILYFSSLIVGSFIGFSVSKLILMILFQITGVNAIATLHFSTQALVQTFIVFVAVYLLIMLVNYVFIKRQTILSLFRVSTSTEIKVKRLSLAEAVLGLIGITLILLGYYVSSMLFSGKYTTMVELFTAMIFILASVIIGSYLFYRGSVRMLLNIIRKKKNGYLNVREVLSLSSIMFRMKSNALLLTVITTVSALAIALLSLSYISYYSAEKTAKNDVPSHFAITLKDDADKFKAALDARHISHKDTTIEVLQTKANLEGILSGKMNGLMADPRDMTLSVISDANTPSYDLKPEQTLFTGTNDLLSKFMSFKDSGQIELAGQHNVTPLTYLGSKKQSFVSWYFTNGGMPVAIVDDSVFQRLKQDLVPSLQKKSSLYQGIDIVNEAELPTANQIFGDLGLDKDDRGDSRLDSTLNQKNRMGLMMFIVGFLGLTFLITSGCILYFKQMDESEDEKPTYTILRKLGYTQEDLLKGIRRKQLFSFGIPLVVGLAHSYFAVQSGWFLFGAELWTPMIVVMVLYTALYSVFGFLSVKHYKKVIRQAL